MTAESLAGAQQPDDLAAYSAAFAFIASSNNPRAGRSLLHAYALNPCHPQHRVELKRLLEDATVKLRLAGRRFTLRQPRGLGMVLGRERVSLPHWQRLPGPESQYTPPLMRDLGSVSLGKLRKLRSPCEKLVPGRCVQVHKEDPRQDVWEVNYELELEAGDLQQTILLLDRHPEPDSVSVVKVDHYAIEQGKRLEQAMGGFVTLFITPHDPFAGSDCG